MKDTWYADKRDLVKWGTLAHLAARENLHLIVQVPFLRHDTRRCLHSQGQEIRIPEEVWQFFRDIRAVQQLGPRFGRQILVLDDVFDPRERDRYRQRIVDRLKNMEEQKVVLLDPDTGIEPMNAKAEHVTIADVKGVWDTLRAGDWLVLYQHSWRSPTWREEARHRVSAACGVQEGVEEFIAPDIASDVAFFAIRRMSDPSQRGV